MGNDTVGAPGPREFTVSCAQQSSRVVRRPNSEEHSCVRTGHVTRADGRIFKRFTDYLECEALLRIQQLVMDFPRIAEVEINPFILAAPGEPSLAVDARLRVSD